MLASKLSSIFMKNIQLSYNKIGRCFTIVLATHLSTHDCVDQGQSVYRGFITFPLPTGPPIPIQNCSIYKLRDVNALSSSLI